jgi:hypothetical protein
VNVRRFLVATALAAALVAPAGASLQAPWTRHRAPGLSIELPAGWANASTDRARILAEVRKLAAKDPELAALMKELLGSGRGSLAVRMIAFDLSASSVASGFFTNLNILREPTDLSPAEWRKAALKSLAAAPFVRQPVWWRAVRLPAGKAARFTYRARFDTGTRRLDTAITQYGIVKGGAAHVLTFTTLPRLATSYRSVFERSARSLRLR